MHEQSTSTLIQPTRQRQKIVQHLATLAWILSPRLAEAIYIRVLLCNPCLYSTSLTDDMIMSTGRKATDRSMLESNPLSHPGGQTDSVQDIFWSLYGRRLPVVTFDKNDVTDEGSQTHKIMYLPTSVR